MLRSVKLHQVVVNSSTSEDIRDLWKACLLSFEEPAPEFLELWNRGLYTHVATMRFDEEDPIDPVVLNRAFGESQEGNMTCHSKFARSASTGDILEYDEQFYFVLGQGFQNVTDQFMSVKMKN